MQNREANTQNQTRTPSQIITYKAVKMRAKNGNKNIKRRQISPVGDLARNPSEMGVYFRSIRILKPLSRVGVLSGYFVFVLHLMSLVPNPPLKYRLS
jgi:hypothetical protein